MKRTRREDMGTVRMNHLTDEVGDNYFDDYEIYDDYESDYDDEIGNSVGLNQFLNKKPYPFKRTYFDEDTD